MTKFILSIILIALPLLSANSQPNPEFLGNYEGSMEAMRQKLDIRIQLKQQGDSLAGFIDIPAQSAYGLKLSNFKDAYPNLMFDLVIGPGNVANFRGAIKDNLVSGDFFQSGISGTFTMTKLNQIDEKKNFIEKDVEFKNGDVKLAGTLTIPFNKTKVPALILLTGSGPQNRDEEIFGFKIFKEIAEYLTLQGYAVLRYDDRSVGGSTGSMANSTGEDFAKDAIAAFNFLRTQSEIDPNTIGLLGHSEGASAAIIAASTNNAIAFVISMSGAAISGRDIIISQVSEMMEKSGVPEKDRADLISLQTEILDAIIANKDLAALKNKVIKYRLGNVRTGQDTAGLSEMKSQVEFQVESEFMSMNTPWYKHFLSFNPATSLAKLKCPILLLYGGLDTQVVPDDNLNNALSALKKSKNSKYEHHIFPTANHLYQEAKSGLLDEYSKLDKKFVEGFLEKISGWLTANLK